MYSSSRKSTLVVVLHVGTGAFSGLVCGGASGVLCVCRCVWVCACGCGCGVCACV